MPVDILMATFDGEKYIRNQLLSLQQQTYEDWNLWVRDDGSSDRTIDILKEFSTSDSRIQLIEGGNHLGAGANFMGLLQYAQAEYITFCDQDDIWLEKKLEFLVRAAKEKFIEEIPCLVYCDAYGYSDSLGVVTINSVSPLHANSVREFLFFNSGYQGSSMIFNRSLCDMASHYRAEYFHMHDDVIALLGHVFGRVSFLPKPLMLYRQHARNVTGNIRSSGFDRLHRILSSNNFVLSKNHFLEKENFFDFYKNQMSPENRTLFLAYLAYPSRSLFGRLWIIFRYRFSIGGHFLPLIIKTILRRPLQ